MAIGELNWTEKRTGTPLPSVPPEEKITGGEAEDIRLKFNKTANILDGQYTKTKSEWEAIPLGTGDRLVPDKVIAYVLDNTTGEVLYSVKGDGSTDVLSLTPITGVKTIPFNSEVSFNGSTKSYIQQTGDISITLAGSQPDSGEHIHEFIIDGDNVSDINTDPLPSAGTADNTKRNHILLRYSSGIVGSASDNTIVSIVNKDITSVLPVNYITGSATITTEGTFELSFSNTVDTFGNTDIALTASGGAVTLTYSSGNGTNTGVYSMSRQPSGDETITFELPSDSDIISGGVSVQPVTAGAEVFTPITLPNILFYDPNEHVFDGTFAIDTGLDGTFANGDFEVVSKTSITGQNNASDILFGVLQPDSQGIYYSFNFTSNSISYRNLAPAEISALEQSLTYPLATRVMNMIKTSGVVTYNLDGVSQSVSNPSQASTNIVDTTRTVSYGGYNKDSTPLTPSNGIIGTSEEFLIISGNLTVSERNKLNKYLGL